MHRVQIDDTDYVGVSRTLTLTPAGEGVTMATHDFPTAIILRSRTDRFRFLSVVHRELLGTAILAVLIATLVSYGIARTVTLVSVLGWKTYLIQDEAGRITVAARHAWRVPHI